MKFLNLNSCSKVILAVALFLGSANASVSVPNDDFANATLISGASGTTTGENTMATQEPEELDFGTRAGASIWWRWTAPESGGYSFDTFGTGLDTRLAIFAGATLGDLELIADNDDSGTGRESKIKFTAEGGTVYYIMVDSFDVDNVGEITLNWAPYIPPTLDAPTMVYNFRNVYTSQGKPAGSSDYARKSTSVITGLVVRGRKTGAEVIDDQFEFGPASFIRLFSYKEGRTTVKRYEVADPEDDEGNMGSGLTRISLSSKGVNETARLYSNFRWVEDAVGKASLSKIFRDQVQPPLWFAKKLTSKRSGNYAANGLEFMAQGEPIPGVFFTNSDTLTFNAAESAAVAGQDFEEALSTIIARLEAKGYVRFVPEEE